MGYLTGISPTLRELVTPTVDVYAAGVGFTAGSSTYIDLSADPGSENNVHISFDGVTQHHDTYSISGVRVTFDAAIPTGTLKIEARYAQENRNYTTIADDAVTLAKMASGTDGNVISYDASGNPVAIATGNDGQVLTSAGAGAPPVFEDASGGWTFVSSVTASDDATVAFTTMTTGYDWKIIAIHILGASDGVNFNATLGVSGPTYRTSGYEGAVSQLWSNSSTPTGGAMGANILLNSSTIGNASADEGLHVVNLELYDPANASTDTAFTMNGQHSNTNNSKSTLAAGGHYTTSEANVAISFQFSSGNIASGVFKLYRRPNA